MSISIVDTLTAEQEDVLRNIHAQNYGGTDDDMIDAYEKWLCDLTDDEIISYLGHA